AQAVDQRVKMPFWMELIGKRGGKLLIQDAGIAELETLAASNDLVLLAAGKGEVVKQFERDASRSPRVPRALERATNACVCAHRGVHSRAHRCTHRDPARPCGAARIDAAGLGAGGPSAPAPGTAARV